MILTKGDLLSLEQLSVCKRLVYKELYDTYYKSNTPSDTTTVATTKTTPGPSSNSTVTTADADTNQSTASNTTTSTSNTNTNNNAKQKEVVQLKKPKPINDVLVISSNTGAGINNLWKYIKDIVYQDSYSISGNDDNEHSVREHKNASKLRYNA